MNIIIPIWNVALIEKLVKPGTIYKFSPRSLGHCLLCFHGLYIQTSLSKQCHFFGMNIFWYEFVGTKVRGETPHQLSGHVTIFPKMFLLKKTTPTPTLFSDLRDRTKEAMGYMYKCEKAPCPR